MILKTSLRDNEKTEGINPRSLFIPFELYRASLDTFHTLGVPSHELSTQLFSLVFSCCVYN